VAEVVHVVAVVVDVADDYHHEMTTITRRE
jgi:hypothetical protein